MAYSELQWQRARDYFESGQYSLGQISEKTGIDKSQISRISKKQQWQIGLHSDYIAAKVKIVEKKTTENTTTISTLDEIADEAILNKGLVYGVTQKALKKLNKMIDEMDNANDIKTAIEASDRASLTLRVNERHAPKVEVSQTNQTAIAEIRLIDA